MRNLETNPYSADENRVVEFLCEKVGLGCGDDPIGFVLVSCEYMMREQTALRKQLRNMTKERSK